MSDKETLEVEIGALHSALVKIEKEIRGVSTAERKSYLLDVIGRVREYARDALRGAPEPRASLEDCPVCDGIDPNCGQPCNAQRRGTEP